MQAVRRPASLHLGLPLWSVAGLLLAPGLSFACGMALAFECTSGDFPPSMGTAGGPGGSLLPILSEILPDALEINPTRFMPLHGTTWLPLILLRLTGVCGCPC